MSNDSKSKSVIAPVGAVVPVSSTGPAPLVVPVDLASAAPVGLTGAQVERLSKVILLGLVMAGYLASGQKPTASPKQLGQLKDYADALEGLL